MILPSVSTLPLEVSSYIDHLAYIPLRYKTQQVSILNAILAQYTSISQVLELSVDPGGKSGLYRVSDSPPDGTRVVSC